MIRQIERENKRRTVYGRLQAEAASRPESRQVQTPFGPIWMSPIELRFYEAMRREGLDPVPQFYIQGYYADFAFPDVRVAVEADGAIHEDAVHKEHDRKRDWILKRQGWTVKRFHGTTIYHKASNCAYVVKQEVEGRRRQVALLAKQREERRQARRDAMLAPFRAIARLFARARRRGALPPSGAPKPPPQDPK